MCSAFSLVSFAIILANVPFIPLPIINISSSGLLTVNQQQCVISAAEASPCANDQTVACVCANIQGILPEVNSCAVNAGCSQTDLNSRWLILSISLRSVLLVVFRVLKN